MTLLEELKSLLKKDERLVSEGNLLKNRIVELALKLDKDLIKLLLSNKKIKEYFFEEVDKTLVFDKEKFMKFVDNKEFLPDSYTAFKNKIGLTADKTYIAKSEEVVLAWPYKDCILEGGQKKEDEKRKEIFYNEILAPDEIDRLVEPKVFTNFKRIDANGEHKVTEIKPNDNLIIKGNNLLVLHSLEKRFAGRVKLIYIDPPYNPKSAANTFTYNNNFNHSSWLTFMKNRIDIAQKLLTDGGIFCISIDHNELFYLGVICDEIFGEDNRIGVIAVETNPGGRSDSEFFATSNEYFIVYTNNIEKAHINDLKLSQEEINEYNLQDDISKYKLVPLRRTGSNSTPDKRPNLYFPIYYNPQTKEIITEEKKGFVKILPIGTDNVKRVWRWSKETIISNIKDIEIKKVNGNYSVFVKDREKADKKPKTMWYGSKYDASSHGTKILQRFNLDGTFSYPKSVDLMKDIIQVLCDKDGIILDYHAGSGTTAQAVLELNREDMGNRQFILCEQMDYIETVTKERVKKVVKNINGVDFVYCELKQLNEEFVQKIMKANDSKELLKIWEEMKQHAFLSYRVDPKLFDENIEEFKKLSAEEQKKLLIECLDANNLYVNYSEIKDSQYKISKEDIELNNKFYRGL